MTQYQVTLDPQTLQRLFSGENQLGQLVEAVLNQVLEAQVAEQLQAAPYERTEHRQGYRNGYKPRRLTTRVGRLTLRVPQVREGIFSTELFARFQRSEQALILTLMEMVVNGVYRRSKKSAHDRTDTWLCHAQNDGHHARQGHRGETSMSGTCSLEDGDHTTTIAA